ncbi:MAG: MgtC/SapB family protein [Firmicutes bacterium]|jgi:putative Mg2+ transporter-C (MgtC) family protein|nr:MgtC/SapB family protein [Bacillota bacterium]
MGVSYLLRLSVAAVIGGLVGFERERINRAAGLRTHILVCVGAALVMLVSTGLPELLGTGDPGRIAAQVVTGVGFLGAGTIMREGASVRGLTTAAGLWVVAGFGLAVGAGMYGPAMAASGIVLAALFLLPPVERRLSRREGMLTVVMKDKPGQLGLVATVLGRHGIDIRHVELETVGTSQVSVSFRCRFQQGSDPANVASELWALDGVSSVDVPAR